MNQLRVHVWVMLGAVGLLGWLLAGPADAQKLRLKQPGLVQAPLPDPGPLVLGQLKEAPPSPRLLQRFGTNQLRHGSRILSLAYSPSGQILAAGSVSDPVRVWDAATGQQKFLCNEIGVNAITFTPRGSLIITGSAFKSIRLWEAANGKDAGKLDGHAAPVKALALAPQGDMLISASQDGVIILWELLTKKKITELKDHTDEVTAIAFCPSFDVPMFVTGSNDRTVRIWNSDTYKTEHTLNAGCGVLAVAISKDGKMVFSGGDDNLIRVWDAETGKLQHTLKGHDGMVVSLAATRDGKLVSGGRDKTIRVWDLSDLQAKPRIIPRNLGDSDTLALSKDGKQIATAGLNNTIRIFETANGKEVLAGDGPQAGLDGVVLSRDGKNLAAVTAAGAVYLWDALTGKLEREWATGHTGEVALAFTPDGQSVVTAAETVGFWDPTSGKQRFELAPGDAKWGPAVGLVFSPDGKTLAVGYRAHQVAVWDVAKKATTESFKCSGAPYALAFSTDGKLLAAAGDSKIVIWDCAAAKELRRFDSKEAPPKTILPEVAALAFSPDRKTLAVACWDGAIRILDYTSGKEVGICEGHPSVASAIEYSHDGRTLLSGSADATVRLWEPFSGVQLALCNGHAGWVHGVALSPDGRTAYSAAADTNVLVWDATGYGKAGAPKAALNVAELEQVWKELASENATAARLVIWRLIGNPTGVAADLKTRVPLVDVPRINKLIDDLDSPDFDDRDAATRELEKQGRWLEGRLKEALDKPLPSLEYKRRIEQLLDKLSKQGALTLRQEQLRVRRVMMVLEYIGDDAAIDLLTRLSKQAPEEASRYEAATTLQRLGKATQKTAGP
jgi:WD40 repeat protein